MDRVKFGRALGYGARHAARTLTQAVDAASAPNPSPGEPSPRQRTGRAEERPPTAPSSRRVPDPQTMRVAGRHAKQSVVAPFVRFSSVVGLQVTGVFFALVAFTMGAAAWRARMGMHAAIGSPAAVKLYAYAAVCALFTYFTISSFLRAARK